jgi:urease accessory protein
MKQISTPLFTLIFGMMWLFISNAVYAHTGVGAVSGFSAGFLHPIGGFDHLLAMIAVGLWAAQMGKKAVWMVPSAFVSVMILGGLLGMSGFYLPYIETGILASVFVLGVFIMLALKLPLTVSVLVVGLFAIFHGHAHGAEMPVEMGGLLYSVGFACATALLHLSGIGLGVLAQRLSMEKVTRFAGLAIVASGVYLVVA